MSLSVTIKVFELNHKRSSSNPLFCKKQKESFPGARQYERTKKLLYGVWLIAGIAALPQIFVWETYRPSSENWEQCVTVFAIKIHKLPTDSPIRNEINFHSMLYEAYHQAMSFWLPLSVTFSCYARMLSRLIPFWPFNVLTSYEDERQET